MKIMADRRVGKRAGPHIPSSRGMQPRSRNKNGTWRKKRADATSSYKYK